MSPSDADLELPRGVALAWGVAADPQRGPKREMSVEQIVDAAVEIADAEGSAPSRWPRSPQRLGYTPMSLYRYVSAKDDLILLMQEGATSCPCPTTRSSAAGATASTAWVLAMRAAYREHPWIVDIPISGAPITPNSLSIVDWFLREVRSLPFSDGEKMSTLLLAHELHTRHRRAGAGPRSRGRGGGRPGGCHGRELLRGARRARDPRTIPLPEPAARRRRVTSRSPGADSDDTDEDF